MSAVVLSLSPSFDSLRSLLDMLRKLSFAPPVPAAFAPLSFGFAGPDSDSNRLFLACRDWKTFLLPIPYNFFKNKMETSIVTSLAVGLMLLNKREYVTTNLNCSKLASHFLTPTIKKERIRH
jgi:hypothetical protein